MPHHGVLFRGLLGVTAVAALLTAGAGTATAHTAPAAHSTAAPAKAFGAQSSPGRYLVDGARIHTQPNTSSTTVGYGYGSHDVTVHCGRVVAGQEWYYHTDNTTHVTGWGRYDVVVPYLAVGTC
ncbi:hypothetical protein [Streptomyces olivaceoviridis]|uniref:hypothetical protein n=1 Tax=Streptomyces olivaceoviridis TaxID=1921 RepID=UPI001675EB87|nr:hypothetical protein [Streptomyces olivaceoviridis]